MAAFALQLDLAKQVNRRFLENERGALSFFSVVLNWVVNFSMSNKYGPILNRRKREFSKQLWRYL